MLTHFVLLSVIVLCLPLFAEDVPEALRPPKGAQLALVVFEDLECPMCAQASPVLHQASHAYGIPLIQHDFPLPRHNWSFDAAVLARYFDTHSKELGDAFRATVFEHQLEISPQSLRAFAEKFAAKHKISLPFAVEKEPNLIALVNADKDLGQNLKVNRTPTIWVVSSKHGGKPFVEVDPKYINTQLYVTIDAMK